MHSAWSLMAVPRALCGADSIMQLCVYYCVVTTRA